MQLSMIAVSVVCHPARAAIVGIDQQRQNPTNLTCFDFKPHFCTKDTPFASKVDGHLPQSRGLFWNVFCKTGRSQPHCPEQIL